MYLDGSGGCGKTFTYNYLSAALNAQSHKVATSVWTATGFAATMLSDGRPVHSFFKPGPIFDTSCFNISPASAFAAKMQQVSLYIVDKASIVSLHANNAIDK